MTGGRRPIEARLSAAGLPPLPRTAWLEIDLDALVANLAAIRASVPPGTAIRPVVKADAYGHGAVPVARALQDAGVDGLCVAAFDEAVELRDAGIEAPIAVLYPVPAGARRRRGRGSAWRSAPGDPVLLARMLDGVAAADGGHPDLAIELEIESGLGRDGFDGADLAGGGRRRSGRPAACAWRACGRISRPPRTCPAPSGRWPGSRRLRPPCAPPASTCRAATRRRAPASCWATWARTTASGRAWPSTAWSPTRSSGRRPAMPHARVLRPILSLRARPVRVLDLPAGSGIGYGPSFVTARPSRIATLPLGYGDGWSRSLSNRAEALVRGRRAPLVGNVSMDAVMVDVTDIPGGPVTPDDEFTLIGEDGGERIAAAGPGADAHHELVGGGDGHGPPPAPGVRCRARSGRAPDPVRSETLGAPDLRAAARARCPRAVPSGA